MPRLVKIQIAFVCCLGALQFSMLFWSAKIEVLRYEGGIILKWLSNGFLTDRAYVIIFWSFQIVLTFAIPVLVIVPVNAVTIVLMYRRHRRHKTLGTARKDSATVTLIAIVLVFVLLRSPHIVLSVMLIIFGDLPGVRSLAWNVFEILVRSAVALNPTMNFVVYFATGKSFRERLRRGVCCSGKAAKDSAISVSVVATTSTRM